MSSTWTDDLVPSGASGPYGSSAPPSRMAGMPPPSGGGFSGRSVALVVIALVVVLAVPAWSLVGTGHSFWPKQWDARLAPITQKDESLRDLGFLHPVPVEFLSDKAFVKRLNADDDPSASDRAEITREEGTFRALGLIGGKADLQKAATAASDAGVLAFYDEQLKEIVVRGTTIDVSHRATLAHELTHVLQDQHFDLAKIEARATKDDEQSGGSSGAVTALIEGDARRVENAYVKDLSPTDHKEYDTEQAKEGATVDKGLASVPPFVSFLFGAPYEFGPLAIRVLIAQGGEAAVDSALTGPTPTSAIYVQTGLTAAAPSDIEAPGLGPDERPDGKPESFGAFETYLAFSMHLTPAQALSAADLVLGGRARGIRKGSQYCYRATVETRDAPAAALVAALGRQWAASTTGGTVRQADTQVTLTACDPGRAAPAPDKSKLQAADELLSIRGALTAEIAEGHVPPETARCISRLYVRAPGALAGLENNAPTPAETARIRSLAQASALECRGNPDAGLP